jgi:hypothetical protein
MCSSPTRWPRNSATSCGTSPTRPPSSTFDLTDIAVANLTKTRDRWPPDGTDVEYRLFDETFPIEEQLPRTFTAEIVDCVTSTGKGRITITIDGCGGRDPHRRNVTYPLISRLAGGTGLPALDTSRLRSTWLADTAALIGLPAFMKAAGITCSQRLGDIIAALDPGDEAAAVTLLGGTAR